MIKSENFATGFQDASSGRRSHTQCANRELGHFVEPLIVDNGADDDDNALVVCHFGHVLGDGAQRQWGSVDAGHEQSFQHDLVEMGTSTPGQVTVQLDQEQQIHVFGLGRSPLGLVPASMIDVDTHVVRSMLYA